MKWRSLALFFLLFFFGSVFLHNAISALFGYEEPVYFFLSLISLGLAVIFGVIDIITRLAKKEG